MHVTHVAACGLVARVSLDCCARHGSDIHHMPFCAHTLEELHIILLCGCWACVHSVQCAGNTQSPARKVAKKSAPTASQPKKRRLQNGMGALKYAVPPVAANPISSARCIYSSTVSPQTIAFCFHLPIGEWLRFFSQASPKSEQFSSMVRPALLTVKAIDPYMCTGEPLYTGHLLHSRNLPVY